jgi:class 3 adenylate cyclase
MSEAGASGKTKPVTALFADISGSTLMYAVRGNEVAFQLTSTCLTLLEGCVAAAGGRVIKRVGDAILAAFGDGEAAVQSAVAMAHALEAPDCPVREENIRVRVGVATGEAVHDAGDIYGDVVNVAARLTSLAGPGEIFLTGETLAALPEHLRNSTRPIDQLALRGRPDWVLVHQYLWKEEGVTVQATQRGRGYQAALEVSYGPNTFALGQERPSLTIGRDPENDVTIEDDVVSRRHAEIVLRGDKFLVIDRSTNGTYVIIDGGDTFRLSREELTLGGSGRIFAGRQTMTPLRYRVRPQSES